MADDSPPPAALPGDGASLPPAARPPRGLPHKSMSTRIAGFLRYYDTDGNGVLDEDEQARALEDLALSQDSEKRAADAAIFVAVRNIRLNMWLVVCLVGMVVVMMVNAGRSFADVNSSIEKTAVTDVSVDRLGVAHLTDKSGREMSTRGTGDLYSAEKVEVRGRVLHCIPVEAAAGMVDSLSQGANVRLAFKGNDGSLEERIVPLGGEFVDAGNALQFGDGKVAVLLDDDSCKGPSDGAKDGEQDEGDDVGQSDFFGRGLVSTVKTPSVLESNREIYRRAREEINKGGQRILNGEGNSLVPVVTGGHEMDTVIIGLTEKPGFDISNRCLDLASHHLGSVQRTFSLALEGCVMELPSTEVASLREKFEEVRYVEPARQEMRLADLREGETRSMMRVTLRGDRSLQSSVQWNLDRIDQCDATLDGSVYNKVDATGVKVYILDTGIDMNHRDFASQHDEFGGGGLWASDACHKQLIQTNQYDDEESSPLEDLNGHGTHIAATACGDIHGVAEHCLLCSVKVIKGSGSGDLAWAVAGIEHVMDTCMTKLGQKCVVNMSISIATDGGRNGSWALHDAIVNAVNAGIVVVVSAGNDSSGGNGDCAITPASEAQAITVGAMAQGDVRSSFSNYGTCVDFFAPGTDIRSAWKGGIDRTASGTSTASPHVAGMVAGILSGLDQGDTSSPRDSVLDKLRGDAKFIDEDPFGSDMWLANTAGGCQPPPTPPPGGTPTLPPAMAHSICAPDEDKIKVTINTAGTPNVIWYINNMYEELRILEDGPYSEDHTMSSKVSCQPSDGSIYMLEIQILSEARNFDGSYTVEVNDVEVYGGGAFGWYEIVCFDSHVAWWCN